MLSQDYQANTAPERKVSAERPELEQRVGLFGHDEQRKRNKRGGNLRTGARERRHF